VFVLFALAASVWLALLVTAPMLPPFAAAALYAVGSQICHQQPARSFHLDSAQLPVCARCLGRYAGGALGAIAAAHSTWRSRIGLPTPRLILVCGALPTAATIVAEWSGAWGGSNAVRAASAVPLGVAVALVVAQAAATLHYERCAPRRPSASNRPPTPT
jgi:uncharacterized membrane protein